MSAPGEHNITHVHGDTFRLQVKLVQPNGTAVNLGGYTAQMQIRSKPGGTVWASSTGGSPSLTLTLGGAAGTIDIVGTISQAAPSRGVYDIQTTVNGEVDTFLAGAFTIISEVTA
jgi:hypothetical protein